MNFLNELKNEFGYIARRQAFLVLVMAPVFYGLFYAYPYIHEVPRNVPIAVVDEDRTPTSRKFLTMIDAAENNVISHVATTMEEAKNAFYDRKVYDILLVPKGFERKILRGEPSDVALYTDGSYLLYYKQSYSSVQLVAATMGAGITLQRKASKGITGPYTSVSLDNYPLYNPIGGYGTYVLPAVFVLICHQLILIGCALITGMQKAVEPTGTPLVRLSAKACVYTFAALMQCMFLFAVVLPFFAIPFNGHIVNLVLFTLPFNLSVVFLGIIMGSYLKVPEAAIIYMAVSSIPLLFLSGVPWAVYSMPEGIKIFRLFLPVSHGIDGFVRIFREGASLAEVSNNLIWLWCLAAAFFPVAWYRLKKQES